MVFPADKETWRRVEGKDLPLSKLGDVIEDTDHNDYADFLERLQDVLGLTILSGFGSVKLRLADMDTKIGASGDFLADGSVPMTGDLDCDGNIIKNLNTILGETGVALTFQSSAGQSVYIIHPAGATIIVGSDDVKFDRKINLQDRKLIGLKELVVSGYFQNGEPTLTEDNALAIWKDTDDANRIYLVFRRGVGDQVKVELT